MPKVNVTTDGIMSCRIVYGIDEGKYKAWFELDKFTQSAVFSARSENGAIELARKFKKELENAN